MGAPVLVVSSGGLPVTEATNGYGMPVTVATNGIGTPITIVSSGGFPVVGSGGGMAVGLFNFSAARMPKLVTDLKAVKAGTGNATIVICSDSNGWGEGGGDSGGNNRVNAKERCWPTVMAKRMTALGIPTTYENVYASGGNVGITAPADFNSVYKAGMSIGGTGWVFSTSTTFGGCLWTNTTDTTSTITIVTQSSCDTMELQYPIVTTAGVISYSIDGGSDVNITETGTNAQGKQTVSLGSLGVHTIVIKRVSGTAFFGGVRFWNSAVKQCQIINGSRCSSNSIDWVVNANPWSPLPSLTNICAGASAGFIFHTINDGLNNTADATYSANIGTIDAAIAGTGADVVYGTGIPSQTTAVSQAIQDRILTNLKNQAVSRNRSMVSFPDLLKDWVTMNANGYTFNSNHANTAGYAVMGNFMGDQFAALAS
jgi:hypothetical protein